MTRLARDERGFTLVETLSAMLVFALVTTGFYSVMLSGVRSSDVAESVAHVSEEARLGLNRMVRDTRQGGSLSDATSTSYTVKVDFDNDGDYEGSDETLTFAYANERITLNGVLLMDGVRPVSGKPVFSYTSNLLQYDWDSNGVTTRAELEAAPSHGVTALGDPTSYLSSVSYALQVTSGDQATTFFHEAQLRNKR